ncbi:PRD domain-containing protein [Enterococcus sp. AZ007]|uniref:PRD domain-containing protein n=2 Tax=Candidatus Enterococcus murrayae TaxID=2815321 RepID=A0ABS3HMD3_9ENTE|nr:PRD domain-containing protein [Enterococcus sp. MJM16]
MKIRQILNNNVALVQRGELDLIVLSNGLSFRKKVGDSISADEVDKVFVPDSNDVLENYSYLLSNVNQEILKATTRIVRLVEEELGEAVNDYLYLTLLDHVDYSLKRAEKGQYIVSPLAWEVRKFYPKQYELSKQALTIIFEETKVDFPESEAVSIALHLINLQETKVSIEDTMKEMRLVGDILTIIKMHYQIQLDEGSMNYNRLVTHLRYFAQRVAAGEIYSSQETEINKQVRMMYPQAFLCVQKISKYLYQQFQKELTKDEETYLMLHISRVAQRKESEE